MIHGDLTPQHQPTGPYSFSQLSLFNKCARRYWCQYVCKERQPETRPLKLGKAIHNAIERAMNHMIENQWGTARLTEWREIADNPPPESNLRGDCKKALNTYQNWLPVLWRDVTRRKSELVPEWTFGLDRNWNPMPWSGDREDSPDGMLFRGAIDLLSVNHLDYYALIWDLKTGRNSYEVFPNGNLPHKQLAVYAWAIFCFYPHIEIVGTSFFNLMNNSEPEAGAVFTRKEAEIYGRDWISGNVADIESRDWKNWKEWNPTANEHCDFCHVKEGCELYQQMMAKGKGNPARSRRGAHAVTEATMQDALDLLFEDEQM